MNRRSGHTAKTGRQREYYIRQLTMLGSEPTVEQEKVFPGSDDFGEDYGVPSKEGKRPTGFSDSVISLLKKYWITVVIPLVITLFVSLMTIFVYNISRDLGSLEGSMKGIHTAIDSFQRHLDKIEDRIQEQEIKIREQIIRMGYLEKQKPSEQIPPK